MKYCLKCKAIYTLSQQFCTNDGEALTLPDPYNMLGRTIADRYRLDALIGMGGMGAVYQCKHLGTDRIIALKILLPNLAVGNPRLGELFEREAKIAGKLKHENIVDIIDAGRTTDGIAYIAMEWLEGNTLDDEIVLSSPLSYTRISCILKQLAAALSESHSHNIIHRDLKPSNIFLVKRTNHTDRVKVMDFGISKLLSETKGSPVSVMMGTPQYASPEQFLLGQNIDTRSDIYSLGVVLFQLITASLPFNDTSINALIYKHLNEVPPPPSSIRSDVPPLLDNLLHSMLAKQPSDRPQRVKSIPEIFDKSISDFVETSNLETATSEIDIPTLGLTQSNIQSQWSGPPLSFVDKSAKSENIDGKNEWEEQKSPPLTHSPIFWKLKYRVASIIRNESSTKLIIPIGIAAIVTILLISSAAHFTDKYEWENAVENERKAFREGRFIDASNLIQDVLKKGESYGANDWHNALALHNAGELYTELARYNEAEKSLLRSLEIREKLSELDTASTSYAIGMLHFIISDKEKAEVFFRKSLTIREKLFGKEHPKVAESLIGWARSLPAKQFEEAELAINRAIGIYEKTFGKNHPDLAKGLSGFAEIMMDVAKPSEIELSFRQALEIREKFYGPNMHPYIAESLYRLGDYLCRRGRCSDAYPYLRRAATYVEAVYGKNHPNTAIVYLSLATLSSNLNNTSDFKDYAEHSLQIIRNSFGSESRIAGIALIRLGRSLTYTDKYKEADTYFSNGLTILERSEKMSGDTLAEAYAIVGFYHAENGAYIKAEQYYQQARNLYEIAWGKDYPIMSILFFSQALNYAHLKEFDKSDQLLLDANSRIQKASGTLRHVLESAVLHVNGIILYKKDNYNNEALDIVSSLISKIEESPLLLHDANLMANLIYIDQNLKIASNKFTAIATKIVSRTSVSDELDDLIQKIELSEAAAGRSLKITQSNQCNRYPKLINEYKAVIGIFNMMKAIIYDMKGNHAQAMNCLRENHSFISAAFTYNESKLKTNSWVSLHITFLRYKKLSNYANEVDTFYKSVRR